MHAWLSQINCKPSWPSERKIFAPINGPRGLINFSDIQRRRRAGAGLNGGQGGRGARLAAADVN